MSQTAPIGAQRAPVVFDLEIVRDPFEVGWDHPENMGVSVAVLYVYEPGIRVQGDTYGGAQFHAFADVEMNAADCAEFSSLNFIDVLPEFLEAAEFVIGYNHVQFDYKVLAGHTNRAITQPRNCDLIQILGPRCSLDALARCELGRGKGADSADLPKLFRQGQIARVLAECRLHVELTRDLYERARRFQRLHAPAGIVTIPRTKLYPWKSRTVSTAKNAKKKLW